MYQTITAWGHADQKTYVGDKWDAYAVVQSDDLFVMDGQDIYSPTSDNLNPEVEITVKKCPAISNVSEKNLNEAYELAGCSNYAAYEINY